MDSSTPSSRCCEIQKKRDSTFKKWDEDYNLIKSEVEALILSFDDMRRIVNPQFQDLTIKFYCIHLCNFFYFHIRKLLIDKNRGCDIEKLLTNGFSNPSSTPSTTVMSDLLSYLVVDDNTLRNLCDEYKKIQELRNKYAHGASSETKLSITMDEYKQIYEDVNALA